LCALLFIALPGVACALSWLLYFAILKMADVSKVASADGTSPLFVLMLSALPFVGQMVEDFSLVCLI